MTHPSTERDPGLDGIVPFSFSCHRCGHCCTAGDGYVWLEPGEDEALARALGMEIEEFRRTHVRTVPDPVYGELRSSLVEEGGRCSLLQGSNHCSVYEARPDHCSRFPYWSRVLETREGFERARTVCPGIAVEVDPQVAERAFKRLEALYREVDGAVERSSAVCIGRGVCCRFEEAGHELYATALEADYAAARHPDPPAPEAEGRCPYHVAGRCTAREGRPLGCRTYFCDTRTTEALERTHEHFLAELRRITAEEGYPVAYGRFPALLEARLPGVGGKPGLTESSDTVVETDPR